MNDTRKYNASRYLSPLPVLGDSHAEILNGLVVSDEGGNDVAFGLGRFIGGINATNCYDMDSDFMNSPLASSLHDFGIVRRVPLSHEDIVFRDSGAGYVPSKASKEIPILFTIGELSAREIVRAIPAGVDIEMPFTAQFDSSLSILAETVIPSYAIESRITDSFRPLFRVLAAVKQTGATVCIASITPPTLNDSLFERLTGICSRALIRLKVYMFANWVIQRTCTELGVEYLDIWADVTENNSPHDGILYDGVHYGLAGASKLICTYAQRVLKGSM